METIIEATDAFEPKTGSDPRREKDLDFRRVRNYHRFTDMSNEYGYPIRFSFDSAKNEYVDGRPVMHSTHHTPSRATSGNGKLSVVKIGDWTGQREGKSSRAGMHVKASWWAEAAEVGAEDLNPAEGARMLSRSGFTVESFYGYSGQIRRFKQDGGYEVIYAMFEEKTVVIETDGICSESTINPKLAAAVAEMCRQEEEMEMLGREEMRHIIAEADKIGRAVFWHEDGSHTILSQAEYADAASQAFYMSADEYYSVSFGSDGLPEVDDDNGYDGIEATF